MCTLGFLNPTGNAAHPLKQTLLATGIQEMIFCRFSPSRVGCFLGKQDLLGISWELLQLSVLPCLCSVPFIAHPYASLWSAELSSTSLWGFPKHCSAPQHLMLLLLVVVLCCAVLSGICLQVTGTGYEASGVSPRRKISHCAGPSSSTEVYRGDLALAFALREEDLLSQQGCISTQWVEAGIKPVQRENLCWGGLDQQGWWEGGAGRVGDHGSGSM